MQKTPRRKFIFLNCSKNIICHNFFSTTDRNAKFSGHVEHSLIFIPTKSQSWKIIYSDSIQRFLCATIRPAIFCMAGRILRTQFLYGGANIAQSRLFSSYLHQFHLIVTGWFNLDPTVDLLSSVSGQFVAGQYVLGQFVAWTIRPRTIRRLDNSFPDNSSSIVN